MRNLPYLVEIDTDEKGIPADVAHELVENLPQAKMEATMDLRDLHYELNDDAESQVDEQEIKAAMKALVTKDTTWFHACGLRLNIENTMFFFNRFIVMSVIAFCMYKLVNDNQCDVMSAYVPVMTALTMAMLK